MCAKTGRGSTCARELKRYPEVGPLYPATKRVPPQGHSFNAALSPTFSTSKQTSSRRPSMPLRPHSPRVLPTSCSFLGSTLSIFDNSLSPFTTKPILCASSQQQRTTTNRFVNIDRLAPIALPRPSPGGSLSHGFFATKHGEVPPVMATRCPQQGPVRVGHFRWRQASGHDQYEGSSQP